MKVGFGKLRRALVLGVPLLAFLAMRLPVFAIGTHYSCNGTISGLHVQNLDVAAGGTCTITNSTVQGDVAVASGAFFEASATTIGGSLGAQDALTVYLHDGSSVGGDLVALRARQLFLFNSTIGGHVSAQDGLAPGFGRVQLCGMSIASDLTIQGMGPDILVGDPAAPGCPGNSISTGSLRVTGNTVDSELVVSGNHVLRGSIDVSNNVGPAEKIVHGNVAAVALSCRGNSAPFEGGANTAPTASTPQCPVLTAVVPTLPSAGSGPRVHRP